MTITELLERAELVATDPVGTCGSGLAADWALARMVPALLAWAREAHYLLANVAAGGTPKLAATDLLARDVEAPK